MNVICYGDSNTFGYDPRTVFGEPYGPEIRWVDILAAKTGWHIVNQGLNGREIPSVPVLIPSDTDLFIVMLGTNDLLQMRPPKDVSEKMERFLKSLNLNREKILLIAPPLMKLGEWVQDQRLIDDSAALGKYYKTMSERLGIRFIDSGQWNVPLAYDGVHLSEEGHGVFAREFCRELGKQWKLPDLSLKNEQ